MTLFIPGLIFLCFGRGAAVSCRGRRQEKHKQSLAAKLYVELFTGFTGEFVLCRILSPALEDFAERPLNGQGVPNELLELLC